MSAGGDDRVLRGCDRIFFRRLEVRCSIGIHAFERDGPQRVLVDVDLYVEPFRGQRPDDIAAVLDYDTIRDGIRELAASGHFELQETLADAIAASCLEASAVVAVRVATEKPDVYPDCVGVGVECLRTASGRGDGIAADPRPGTMKSAPDPEGE